MNGTMQSAEQAQVTTVIHFPQEDVWRTLLDPEAIPAYMLGARITTDWQEGSDITWRTGSAEHGTERKGRVLAVREPDLLRYTLVHGSDGVEKVVSFELREVAGKTHLRVTQDGNASTAEREAAEENWNLMLDGLKQYMGEAPVPPPEEPHV
jgi:uncharacterized protein YndB with AHSA1/START domain